MQRTLKACLAGGFGMVVISLTMPIQAASMLSLSDPTGSLKTENVFIQVPLKLAEGSATAIPRRERNQEGVNPNPGIAPIGSTPGGKTYGQWIVEWWKWVALRLNKQTSPMENPNAPCSNGQQGDVWFIGTANGDGQPIERSCTIPRGKALFFQTIAAAWFSFLNDPPRTRTPDFAMSFVSCEAPSKLYVWIDGVPVKYPSSYLATSPLFRLTLPYPNVFDLQGTDPNAPNYAQDLVLDPSISRGYWFYLQPLSAGQHTVKWKAEMYCPSIQGSFKQDVTYKIMVQ